MKTDIKHLKIILESLDPVSELHETLEMIIEDKEQEETLDVQQLINFTLSRKGYGIQSNNDTGIVTVRKEDEMWDFTIPLKMKITQEQYAFLCDLRRSGKTNMFDAGKYLVVEYGVSFTEATELVKEWMNKFTKEDY